MHADELRQKFLDFFEKNGHTIVPSSSLIPDDPSVLLTTAGMQQFKPYYSELDPEKTIHPSIGKSVGKNAVSVQKSFRTSDIDEVGDESHLTFFEMLGNFSFGGYFKERTIELAYQFLVKELGLEIAYVTVFEGKNSIGVPKDEESIAIWKKTAPGIKVIEQGMDDVFWGPTGSSGPCGPTTEIYIKNGAGEDIEVWNCVFNQYFYPGSREELNQGVFGKKLEKLKIPGVDTGMGFERLAMVVQKKKNIFETDLFSFLWRNVPSDISDKAKRIIGDHSRAILFLVSDGVVPSNKEAGYVLRKMIRRVLAHSDLPGLGSSRGWGNRYGLGLHDIKSIFEGIQSSYGAFYPELSASRAFQRVEVEFQKFGEALQQGIRALDKEKEINSQVAFKAYESYGIPFEIIKDFFPDKTVSLQRDDFEEEFKKHQEISRAGQEKKFGGHGLLLDTGELKAADERELKIVTRLHTATHMLQQALREVLGPDVHQAGSDITVERTRFDFTFSRKLTPEEIKRVEDLVNQKIKEDLPMQKKVFPKSEAEKTGALYFFKEKYPDPVNVYFIGKSLESAWSKEFCGGPHVTHIGEIGKFRIAKEEAIGAGIRRIRAVVE